MPSYAFDAEAPGLTKDQVKKLADACMTEHRMYAEFALQDPHLREQLPVVPACATMALSWTTMRP